MRIFVYGTLKRGFHNFERLCQGVASVEPAEMLGRLFDLPAGYPMLAVPPETIVAHAQGDPRTDEALRLEYLRCWPVDRPAPRDDSAWSNDDWEWITGEILTFADPVARLPRLDALEGFHPPGRSLYHRVLCPVGRSWSEPLWVYIAPHGQLPSGAQRVGRSWPDDDKR